MFSDVDGAVDVQTAQPKQEAFSQVMHLTVKGKPGWPQDGVLLVCHARC